MALRDVLDLGQRYKRNYPWGPPFGNGLQAVRIQEARDGSLAILGIVR